jgi:ribosomal protein S27AE
LQRREFHDALLEAGSFEDLPGKWQAAILKAEENRPNLQIVDRGNMPEQKTFTSLRADQPATEFPKNRRTRDGLSSWRAACHRAANARWRHTPPAAVERHNASRRVKREQKACASCGTSFVPARRDQLLCSECRLTPGRER